MFLFQAVSSAEMAGIGPTVYRNIDPQVIALLAKNDPAAIRKIIEGVKTREDVPGNLSGSGNKERDEQGYMAAKNLLIGMFDRDSQIRASMKELNRQKIELEGKLAKDEKGPDAPQLKKQIQDHIDQIYALMKEGAANYHAAVWLTEKYIDVYDFDYSKLEFYQGKLKEAENTLSHSRTQEEKTSAPEGFKASRGMRKTAAAIEQLGGYRRTETEGGLQEQLDDTENKLVALGTKRINASLEPWTSASQAYSQALQALEQGTDLKTVILGLEEAASHVDNLLPSSEAGKAVKNLIEDLGQIADGKLKKDPQKLVSNYFSAAAKAEEVRKGFEASADKPTAEEVALAKKREDIKLQITETEETIAYYQKEIEGAEYFNKKWNTYISKFNRYENVARVDAQGKTLSDFNGEPMMGKKFVLNQFAEDVGAQHTTSYEGVTSTGKSMWAGMEESYNQSVVNSWARDAEGRKDRPVDALLNTIILNPGAWLDGLLVPLDYALQGYGALGDLASGGKPKIAGLRVATPFRYWFLDAWDFSKELFNFSPTGEPAEKWAEAGKTTWEMTSIPAHERKNEQWDLAYQKPTPRNIKLAAVYTQTAWLNTGMLALSAIPAVRAAGRAAMSAYSQSMKPLLLKRLETDIMANVIENTPKMIDHFTAHPNASQLISKETMAEFSEAAKKGGVISENLAKKVATEVTQNLKKKIVGNEFRGAALTLEEFTAAMARETGFRIEIPGAMYTMGQTISDAAVYTVTGRWALPIARGAEKLWMRGAQSPINIQIAALANGDKQAIRLTVDKMVYALQKGGMDKKEAQEAVLNFVAENAEKYLADMASAFEKYGVKRQAAKAAGKKAAQTPEEVATQKLYEIIEFKNRVVDELARQNLKKMKLKAAASQKDRDLAGEMALRDVDNVFKKYFYITVDEIGKPVGKASAALKGRKAARQEVEAPNKPFVQDYLEGMVKAFNEQNGTGVSVAGKEQALQKVTRIKVWTTKTVPEMPDLARDLLEGAGPEGITEKGRIAWKEFWSVANDVTKGIFNFKEHGRRLFFKAEKMKEKANNYLTHLNDMEEEAGAKLTSLKEKAVKDYGELGKGEKLSELLDKQYNKMRNNLSKMKKKKQDTGELEAKLKDVRKDISVAVEAEKKIERIQEKTNKVFKFLDETQGIIGASDAGTGIFGKMVGPIVRVNERRRVVFQAMYDQYKEEGAFSLAPTWMQSFRKTLQEKTLLGKWDQLSSEAREINKKLDELFPKMCTLSDESPEIQRMMREIAGKNRIMTPSDYEKLSDAVGNYAGNDAKLLEFNDLCKEYGNLIGRRVEINWQRRGLFTAGGVALSSLPLDAMLLNAEFTSSAAAALVDYYAIRTAYNVFRAVPTTLAIPLIPIIQDASELPPKMDLSGWVPKPTGKMNASPGTYVAQTDASTVAFNRVASDSNITQAKTVATTVAKVDSPKTYRQPPAQEQKKTPPPPKVTEVVQKQDDKQKAALNAMAELSMGSTRHSVLLAIGINEEKKDLSAKEKAFLKMLTGVQEQEDKQKAIRDLTDIRGAIQAALDKVAKSSDAQTKKQQQILGTMLTEIGDSYNKSQFMAIMTELF